MCVLIQSNSASSSLSGSPREPGCASILLFGCDPNIGCLCTVAGNVDNIPNKRCATCVCYASIREKINIKTD